MTTTKKPSPTHRQRIHVLNQIARASDPKSQKIVKVGRDSKNNVVGYDKSGNVVVVYGGPKSLAGMQGYLGNERTASTGTGSGGGAKPTAGGTRTTGTTSRPQAPSLPPPPKPTADNSYTPDSEYAKSVMDHLQHLQQSMSQDDFANLMHTYGGTGDASGNGYLGSQTAGGAGQMAWPGGTPSSTPSMPTGATLGVPDPGNSINVPTNPGSTLQSIHNNPPNPGNFPGSPPTHYPGGGGIPAPPGGGNTFSGAPPRPTGPSGIQSHAFITHANNTATAAPSGTGAAAPSGTATAPTGNNTSVQDNANASMALQQMLDQWGLGSLAGNVLDFLQQGYDTTSIQYLLTQTPEYQRRFAGNEARIKNGLGALSPAEYIATERSYQDILRSAGLPAGFYDSPDDFTQWISGDVSPSEVANRVQDAVKYAQATDPTARTALSAYYGIDQSHIAAYFLDPQRAMPLLQKQANAADIGAAALHQGLGLTNLQDAFAYTDQGVTGQQAQAAYSNIADILPTESAIAQRFGQNYNQTDAEQELLGGMASAARKRRNLNQQEQALFAGTGGVGQTYTRQSFGLAQDTAGI